MKKIILSLVAVMTFSLANAQEGAFKAGVNLGLPMGDIKDSFSLNIGLDVAYTWEISDEFNAGIGLGYSHYLGKTETFNYAFGVIEIKNDDGGFIPVYGTAQYSISENIFAGADLGYAVGISPSGNDGGFLYQPKVGYQTEKVEVFLGYKGISRDGGSFSSINLGFNFKF